MILGIGWLKSRALKQLSCKANPRQTSKPLLKNLPGSFNGSISLKDVWMSVSFIDFGWIDGYNILFKSDDDNFQYVILFEVYLDGDVS